MSFYPNVVAAVRVRAGRASTAEASHLLMMCAEVESTTDPFKAARWVGWMLCKAETFGWWTNGISRDLVRSDVLQGRDQIATPIAPDELEVETAAEARAQDAIDAWRVIVGPAYDWTSLEVHRISAGRWRVTSWRSGGPSDAEART